MVIKISAKKEVKFNFEEVIKHISNTYIGDCPVEKEKGSCEICNYYFKILEKYKFTLNTKEWDYDD